MSLYNKQQLITSTAPVLSKFGIGKLFHPFFGGIGTILTFHRVIPPSKKLRIHNHLSLEISPKHLEEVIQFFKRKKYHFLSLDELYEGMRSGNIPKPFVVFTFDDGYRDNLEYAYPVLQKYNVPFCIYVTTQFPDGDAILWWYLLEDLVRSKEEVFLELDGEIKHFPAAQLKDKEVSFSAIRTILNERFQQGNHQELLQQLFPQTDLQAYARTLSLNWDEIRQMSQEPLVTIGAHTINHYPLSRLNRDELRFEILGSKERLEDAIGQEVAHFAYPFGKRPEASTREFDFVKNTAIKTATTTRIGNIFPQHAAFMEKLPRVSVNKLTDKNVLNLQTSGFIPCVLHKGKRVVTV